MTMLVRLAILLTLATLAGCAALPQACVAPARMMASAELLFGRNVGRRLAVSDAAFAEFLAQDITPGFPDGLTAIDARGQWRDGSGALVREPSKLVLIVFADDDAQKRAALVTIADSYKRKFRQTSVLVSVRAACVSF
jgi:hypothetical protein